MLVARALAAEPELLIMDEPTAGVDAASQEALAGTLAASRRPGTTLVVVTHETGPLAGVLDRAVVVDSRPDRPTTARWPAPATAGGGRTTTGRAREPPGYRLDQPTRRRRARDGER